MKRYPAIPAASTGRSRSGCRPRRLRAPFVAAVARGGARVPHRRVSGPASLPASALVALLAAFALPVSAQQVVAPGSDRYERPFDVSRGVLSYSDLIEPALRASVKIYSLERGEQDRFELSGSGSGVVYDAAEGLVLTNEHVVGEADGLLVELYDGVLVEAKAVGTDPRSDLAVVRTVRPLEHEATFVDSGTIRVGDVVFAVGYPRGLDRAISSGVISGLNRRGFQSTASDPRIEDFIQTDAAINPGNSGGPLFDSRGRVVGINTFIFQQSDGLGFAVPGNIAVQVARQLVSGRPREPGWFGVTVDSLVPTEARERGLATTRGVVIEDVEPGSPAERAGLRPNDIITGAGNRRIDDVYQFANFILLGELGRRYDVYFLRGTERSRTKIVLTTEDGLVPAGPIPSPDRSTTSARSSTELLGASLGLDASGRIVATDVAPTSQAYTKGLRSGDRILALNREPVRGLRWLAEELERLAGQGIALRVERDERRFMVVL